MLDTDLPAIRGFPEPGNGLGASMGLAKATHVDAERPAKDLSCNGLVDVSADEQTASVLRAADRCAADVPGAALRTSSAVSRGGQWLSNTSHGGRSRSSTSASSHS